MIRIVLNVDRGFALWPIYVIPKWCVGTDREEPYIVHEETHCRRQRWWSPVWWVLWIASKKFRRREELLAYEAEISEVRRLGGEVDFHYYVNEMVNGYGGMISYLDAAIKVNRWML